MDDETIRELFDPLGHVSIRKMFGGKGIYFDGRIIAVWLGEGIALKGDDQAAPLYEEAGLKRWTYENKAGKNVSMPYWALPEEAYDDPDEMLKWARLAVEASLRAKK